MLAKLHLADDAFALHLLLEYLEGLVDIVVTDENLHVVFLFNPTVDRSNGQGAWGHWRAAARKRRLSLYSIRPLIGSEKPCQEKITAKIAGE